MMKIKEALKSNKSVLIVTALIIMLIVILVIMNGTKKTATASSLSQTELSQTEVKLTRILTSIDGVGNAEVMVNENQGEIDGVVIVCEGADNIMTRNDILNVVSTALNIDGNIIAVYAMNK